MIDVRQTKEHAAFLQAIGWTVVQSPKGVFAYIRTLPIVPIGVIKIQRVPQDAIDFAWLKRLAQQYRAAVAYVETSDVEISRSVFWIDRSPMLPTKTLLVDLRKSLTQLLAEMKTKTRYNIKLAARKKLLVSVICGDDMVAQSFLFDEYYALMQQNAARLKTFEIPRSWVLAQLRAFGEKAFVVMVKDQQSTLVAAAMFVTSPDSVFYSHNGSTAAGRALFAPTLAVWEGMREGKRRGLSWFDFEGIFDDRYPLPRWRGFTRFKLGFGGKEVTYPPVRYCVLPGIRLH